MADGYRIVDATPEHVRLLGTRLRLEDEIEVTSLGLTPKQAIWRSYRHAILRRTAFIGDEIAAMWGVNGQLLSNVGRPWLLTAPVIETMPLAFLKEARREVRDMLEAHPVLINHVQASYTRAIRFLELAGFTMEPPQHFGPLRVPFRRFSMRREYQHFRAVGEINITPLREAVRANAHRFGEVTWRQSVPGSPHPDTETIFLRMPRELTRESLFNSLQVEDCDAEPVPAFLDAIREIGALTGGRVARCMIVKLKPGGKITPHIDQGRYAEATQRWHLPIETNRQAWLQSGGETLSLPRGTLHWFDKHALHCGANEGPRDRIHLIVDTFR
jgi:hypothetical protein